MTAQFPLCSRPSRRSLKRAQSFPDHRSSTATRCDRKHALGIGSHGPLIPHVRRGARNALPGAPRRTCDGAMAQSSAGGNLGCDSPRPASITRKTEGTNMTEHELDRIYTLFCKTITETGEARSPLFLARFALLAIDSIGDAET